MAGKRAGGVSTCAVVPGSQLRLLWEECARRALTMELACHLNVAHCHNKLEQWSAAIDAAGARHPR